MSGHALAQSIESLSESIIRITRQTASDRIGQNTTGRKIALVVLGQGRWKPVRRRLDAIVAAVDAAMPGSYTEVELPVE
jgi:hypothetical protein